MLDRVLSEEKKKAFRHHLGVCRICQTNYETERDMKSLVKQHVSRVAAPSDLVYRVKASLKHERKAGEREGSWLDKLVGRRALVPALGFALVVAALFYFSQMTGDATSRLTVHTASNDIINQTFRNFASIRSGDLKPTMISCYPEGVVGFFERDQLKFAVNMIPVENCDWYGAISSEFDGVKLAHVVYRIGDDTMYVYQVDKREAMDGKTLTLPPAAKEALAKTGWYTDPSHPECNVILWTEGETLCSAVSNMNKDRLFAFLTTR